MYVCMYCNGWDSSIVNVIRKYRMEQIPKSATIFRRRRFSLEGRHAETTAADRELPRYHPFGHQRLHSRHNHEKTGFGCDRGAHRRVGARHGDAGGGNVPPADTDL